jgi:hypothetical protein
VNSDEATAAVIDSLEAMQIPYMLVGSFSTNFYGIPRSTHDADFVLQLRSGVLSTLIKRLCPPFRIDPQMSFETVTATTRYALHLAEGPFSIELFMLSDDAHDQQRFTRRRREHTADRDAFVPSVEDVIITKLRWSRAGRRAKDVDDARNVIAVQGDRIDWDYVNSWCDRHGTRELLEDVRRSIPPE